ncbi:ShK domain-like protein [Nitzschia inconspicua]|uniref:ShK domain-like protein n=1 Tax=Nitzschia inconspicua TaxID=303405 RepID=A0A9K3P7R7_9STRA|nr:ShK domain-like protein [Nitzschia inconspicua]KAG7336880.1 ShK domain-like protein [Nitzschia inconspicua]KAG7337031.1 ShK domain-like protein [Nitzschia inconspicua]KAG7344682.1 ShK domain-like protein [Nitzschia inconspicua]KAG7370420.1 ShK domain-like protein [Nitzschia inconspicua]
MQPKPSLDTSHCSSSRGCSWSRLFLVENEIRLTKQEKRCIPYERMRDQLIRTAISLVLALVPFTAQLTNGSSINTSLDQFVCVDIGEPEMVCTDQVLETRQQVDGKSVNVGVTQRIDGSETEKAAIREVLQRMDEYFVTEVLALPEYAYARHRCKNSNELCAFWSSVGECETNRVFMLTNCPAACRFCLLLNSGIAS